MNARENPPRLIAMTARSLATPEETLRRFERVARAAAPFTVMFQLRDRELSARERLAFGQELRALCTAERQWFQVNDRCDLAVLLGSDAVHLGEASVSAADARRVVGADMFVTRACHDPEREFEADVDAWLLSPVFAARKGSAALGVVALERLVERANAQERGSARVFALGGVNTATARQAAEAGAGVAAIGAVLDAYLCEGLLESLGIGFRTPDVAEPKMH